MEKFKRLEILIELLSRKRYPTKEELLSHFYDTYQMEISARTLERDFRSLTDELHIDVAYNRNEKGYYLENENDENVLSFLKFAGRAYLSQIFQENLKDFEEIQDKIKLEEFSSYKGTRYITPLFLAIKQERIIDFSHENYSRASVRNHQILPLQLREFQGRWYVVGIPIIEGEPEKMVKIYGLERISQLKTGSISSIDTAEYASILDKFSHIVGLNFDEGEKRELIELAVTPHEYKYLKSLPIHPTQLEKGNLKDGRIQLSLYVIPNYELKMQLLKFGQQIEVLSPEKLRLEMKTIFSNALKNYNDER